jgi:hypothetical protein
MQRMTTMPCLQAYCRLPNLARRSVTSDKPCKVLAEVPTGEGTKPTEVLECPLCGTIFHRVTRLALWRELEARGVPKEGMEPLEWNVLPLSAKAALEEASPERASKILEDATDQRVEMIGRDITMVDSVPYFR